MKTFGVQFARRGTCTYAKCFGDRSGELEFTHIEDMDKAIRELDRRRFAGSDDKLIAREIR